MRGLSAFCEFCEESEIVCGAVVGVSSISVEDLISVGMGSNSPLRLVERDKIVVEEGLGAGRGGGGLAARRCASCAVSCAMRGVESVLVCASWERRAEGFCKLGGLVKLLVVCVGPALLWRGWAAFGFGVKFVNGGSVGVLGFVCRFSGCELVLVLLLVVEFGVLCVLSKGSGWSSCGAWGCEWCVVGAEEEEEEDEGGDEGGLPGCFCLGRMRRRAFVNQLLIWLRVSEVVVARPAFSSSVGYGCCWCSSSHRFSSDVAVSGNLPRRFLCALAPIGPMFMPPLERENEYSSNPPLLRRSASSSLMRRKAV